MRGVESGSDLVRRLNMIEKTEKIIKKAAVTLFGEEFTLPVEYDVLGGESLLD